MAGQGQDWISSTLRELRLAAGLSQTAAAKAVGKSQAGIARIETGRYVPREHEMAELCRAYRAPAGVRRQLVQAARDLREETTSARIAIHRGEAHRLQDRIKRIEEASAEIRSFQPVLVPGLLQTEDYARAVFAQGGDIAGEDLDRSVAIRMSRQEALTSDRKFTFVISEGALRWQAISPAVMAGQIERLGQLAGRMRVGVIPWTRAVDTFPVGGFELYDAREVTVGTWTGTSFITTPKDVADYVRLFGALEGLAVFAGAAEAVFVRVAAEYRALS
jgi:transcriptional regulator with XRE-family HTH domain